MRPAPFSSSKPDWRAALLAVREGGIAVFQPGLGPLAGQRIARALLHEAATLGGGQVISLPGGDVLLGGTAPPGQRAAQTIGALLGSMPESWPLPLGLEAAMARCEEHCEAAPPPTLPPAFTLAGLEAHCAALPLEDFARVTLFAEGPGTAPVAQRLGPAPLRLEDAGLEAMAREWLCRRVLAALTNPAQRHRLPPLRPGLRLILDLPQAGMIQAGPIRGGRVDDPNAPIALLPLSALANPAGFSTLVTGLRQSGWAVGLLAEDPRAIGWVAPQAMLTGVIWATPWSIPWPGGQAPLPSIVVGHPVPDACRVPGILHEGCE